MNQYDYEKEISELLYKGLQMSKYQTLDQWAEKEKDHSRKEKEKEFKTLSEWFPDGKPDGRKFVESCYRLGMFFQPFFRDKEGLWYGLDHNNETTSYSASGGYEGTFKEYTPPKKMKKLLMYKPIRKTSSNFYKTHLDDEWYSDKSAFFLNSGIVGWLTMEVEIEE